MKKGFTLLELLVVISIVSMLTSVVIASLANTRKKGDIATRNQIARQFEIALRNYSLDNDGLPVNPALVVPGNVYYTCLQTSPTGTCGGTTVAGGIINVDNTFLSLIDPYIRTSQDNLSPISVRNSTFRGFKYTCYSFNSTYTKCMSASIDYLQDADYFSTPNACAGGATKTIAGFDTQRGPVKCTLNISP